MRTSTDPRGAASSKTTNASLPWEKPTAIDGDGGDSGDEDGYSGFGGNVREGRPLLLDEVQYSWLM